MVASLRPTRIVHLIGGLRAVDARTGRVSVQVDANHRLFEFQAPDYPKLYQALVELGFEIVGVEFLTGGAQIAAPDWWCASPRRGFKLEFERRSWNEVRTLALRQARSLDVDISRRFSSLLSLLAIRAMQLSDAYNAVFRASVPVQDGHLFDNTFVPHLEAAIHGFLTDAASLRDLLIETVWRYVLKRDDKVSSFKTFRTAARSLTDPLVVEVLQEGTAGWIKELTDLRNNVIHVAPVGSFHTLPACYSRRLKVGNRSVQLVSYGLLLRSEESEALIQNAIYNDDSAAARFAMTQYQQHLLASKDALSFAWILIDKLVELTERCRLASGLQGEVTQLGPEDILDSKRS